MCISAVCKSYLLLQCNKLILAHCIALKCFNRNWYWLELVFSVFKYYWQTWWMHLIIIKKLLIVHINCIIFYIVNESRFSNLCFKFLVIAYCFGYWNIEHACVQCPRNNLIKWVKCYVSEYTVICGR